MNSTTGQVISDRSLKILKEKLVTKYHMRSIIDEHMIVILLRFMTEFDAHVVHDAL